MCIILFLRFSRGSRYFAVPVRRLLQEKFEVVVVFILGEEDLKVGV